jgi:cell division protein FtsN
MMEHKQTLWIISAAGVFLLVVVGAALILYSPSASSAAAPVAPPVSVVMPGGLQQGATQGLVQRPVGIATVPAALPSDLASLAPPAPAASNEGLISLRPEQLQALLQDAQNAAATTLASLPAAPVTSAPPPAPVPSVSALSAAARQAVTAPARPAPAAASAPTVAPVPRPASPAVKAPPQSAASGQYWIQAASFTSKKNADSVRVMLAENRMPGEVFTHTDTAGTVFYRVRVGPYPNKSEAEYWQGQLRSLKNFEQTPTFVVRS